MTNILVAGITVADFVFELEVLPAVAEKYTADSANITIGGCAANASVAISRLGSIAWLASRVGDDVIGDLIIAELSRHSVNTDLLQCTPASRSAFSAISIDRSGERQIVNFRGENLSDDTRFITHAAPPVDAVLVDTRWESGAVAALELARQRGIPGVLDAEAPVSESTVMLATHVAFSRQGLRDFTANDDLLQALPIAARATSAWVCVTDGANGVYYYEDSRIQHIPAVSITAIDTLGAGDVWHGAFALKLGAGENEQHAISFANEVAAMKCTRVGGGSVTPTLDELNRNRSGSA